MKRLCNNEIYIEYCKNLFINYEPKFDCVVRNEKKFLIIENFYFWHGYRVINNSYIYCLRSVIRMVMVFSVKFK